LVDLGDFVFYGGGIHRDLECPLRR